VASVGLSACGNADEAPLYGVVDQLLAASGSCSVALMTSRANAARCDVSASDDDGDGVAGINVDNMDHGARLADFPSTISVGVGSYTFRDWLDVLRVLWAGADNTRNFADGGSNGQRPTNRAARCGSAIRRALVSNWDNIVEDLSTGNACGAMPANPASRPTSCEDPSTGLGLPLRHLFRPGDSAPVTATFLSLLNLATSDQEPFCNGSDTKDDDPIRVRCTTNNVSPTAALTDNATQLNDETCGADGTTGLVLPITIPAVLSADTPFLYPTVNCDTGHFEVRRPPQPYFAERRCPDGSPFLFTGCLTPVSSRDDCRCVNAWTNRAPGAPDLNPSIGGVQNDGRIWNRFYRGRATPANACPILPVADLPGGTMLADARLRYRVKTVNQVAVPRERVCRFQTPTEQIGCLSQAAECSIGFENPEALVDTAAVVPYTAATLLEGPTCF
jgi:hypothetical protein